MADKTEYIWSSGLWSAWHQLLLVPIFSDGPAEHDWGNYDSAGPVADFYSACFLCDGKKTSERVGNVSNRSSDDWSVLDYDAWQSFIWINLSRGIACAFTAMIYNVEPRKLLMQFPVTILQGWAFLMGGLFFSLVFHIWTISYTPPWMGYLGIAFVVLVGNVLAFTSLINQA